MEFCFSECNTLFSTWLCIYQNTYHQSLKKYVTWGRGEINMFTRLSILKYLEVFYGFVLFFKYFLWRINIPRLPISQISFLYLKQNNFTRWSTSVQFCSKCQQSFRLCFSVWPYTIFWLLAWFVITSKFENYFWKNVVFTTSFT